MNDLLEINLNTKASYTIGGLVMNELGHIPDYGESMIDQGYKFSVQERTDKAILKLKIESI